MDYTSIFTPITIGSLTLKNRIFFAPTSMGLSDENYILHIETIAKGGCSLIIIGDVPVCKSPFHSLYSKKGFAFYKKVVDAAHAHGACVSAQLHMSDSNLLGMLRYVPGILTKKISGDEIRILLNEQVSPYITGMSKKKIKHITRSFGTAAKLAEQAGFDMIQVHGDRMCGSFCSSLYNHRKDEYGGSVLNRARFFLEAVQSVRNAVPSMPIDIKLPVRQENPHYGNAGILDTDLPLIVPKLEEAGANSFHVTLANHGSLTDTIPPANHPYFKEEGCFLKYSDLVKQLTTLPVCGVGALRTPQFIESILTSGRVDCVAMSRQLIADSEWVNKISLGNDSSIKRCVRCNKNCLGGMQRHEGVHCIYETNKV